MKGRYITLIVSGFILSSLSFANGVGKFVDESSVDKKYEDEIKLKESALERQEKTKEKMNENPRNAAMAESFGHVYSKEDDQEIQEEKKVIERQEEQEAKGTLWDN